VVQTQKDHVEAYSFLIGRMTSALVLGDAGNLEVPAKRTWTGLVMGAVISVLIAAGFFVFGLITHHAAPAAPPAPARTSAIKPAAPAAPPPPAGTSAIKPAAHPVGVGGR
jgi:hypothetical protein